MDVRLPSYRIVFVEVLRFCLRVLGGSDVLDMLRIPAQSSLRCEANVLYLYVCTVVR